MGQTVHIDPACDRLLELRLEAKETIADDVVLLTLVDPDGAHLPEWQPGAHVDLVLRPDLVRPYSLCGSLADRNRWQVAVLRERDGRGGSELIHTSLAPGDTVGVRPPRNNFPLVEAPSYVFIAGGIGITPIVPMIAAVHERGADWTLHYGGRSSRSMAFLDWLEPFRDHVRLYPEDVVGLIDLDAACRLEQDGTAIYCCGPEGLIAAVEERGAAWPDETLHLERFHPKEGVLDSDCDQPFEVVAVQSGVTVVVEPGQSIVEALEDEGVFIPTSCGEGTCETCLTRVVSGVPEHRDSILTEEQRADNLILPCCSRARSDRLELDV